MIGVRMANYRVINRWRSAWQAVKSVLLGLIITYSIAVFAANISYYGRGASELKWLPKISFGIDIVGGNQLTVAIDSSGVSIWITTLKQSRLFAVNKSLIARPRRPRMTAEMQ